MVPTIPSGQDTWVCIFKNMAGKRVGIGAKMKFRMSIDPVSSNGVFSETLFGKVELSSLN